MGAEEYSLTKLNKPLDWEKLPDMAKKHTPIIEAPDRVRSNEPFSVKVKVGGIDGVEHPNTQGHWVNWVELYSGERKISRIEFEPEMCDSYSISIDITISKTSTLRVQEFCNLHGVWEGKEKKVIVE